MSVRILAAGGGTSGHINPAIAIADRIMADAPGSVIEFCGTSRGIEKDLIPKAGYRMHEIRASGFPSKISVKMLRAILDFRAGRKACIDLIRSFRPDAVVGTGGYVCSPLVSAAEALKVPVILHEQNAFPGRSNRVMARKAQAVCTGFPGMDRYFKSAGRVIYTGNPIRKVFGTLDRQACRKTLGFDPDTFIVLAMGGSLGSRTINHAVTGVFEYLHDERVHVILSAGKQQYEELKKELDGKKTPVEIFEYIDETHVYMAAADLIVCRAGAITCAEVAAVGVPSVMVPYPFAAGDHQSYNARAFREAGAGVTLQDAELTSERLSEEIGKFLADRQKASEMGRNAKKLYFRDSDTQIARIVLDICASKNAEKENT